MMSLLLKQKLNGEEKLKKFIQGKKRGDINYVLGIVAVSVIMILIVAAVKGWGPDDLVAKVHDFITNTLFDHIKNPFDI